MLGLIELRPTGDPDDAISDGTGMMRVAGSEKLFERITEHPNERVDSRAFLAARLFDMFVGDWDRHPDQWRWARIGNTPNDQWLPIPRDRDWALVKLDGLAWSLARFVYPFPQFVSFDAKYSDVIWLTWNGRALDRRLLSELPRPVWDSVAMALQAKLPDSVIDEAIRQLPAGLATASGDFLRSTLASRREHLREAARHFYDILADEPEIHTTDESELVEVTRAGPRTTDVRVRQRSKSGGVEPQDWYHRRFDAERDTRDPDLPPRRCRSGRGARGSERTHGRAGDRRTGTRCDRGLYGTWARRESVVLRHRLHDRDRAGNAGTYRPAYICAAAHAARMDRPATRLGIALALGSVGRLFV